MTLLLLLLACASRPVTITCYDSAGVETARGECDMGRVSTHPAIGGSITTCASGLNPTYYTGAVCRIVEVAP